MRTPAEGDSRGRVTEENGFAIARRISEARQGGRIASRPAGLIVVGDVENADTLDLLARDVLGRLDEIVGSQGHACDCRQVPITVVQATG